MFPKRIADKYNNNVWQHFPLTHFFFLLCSFSTNLFFIFSNFNAHKYLTQKEKEVNRQEQKYCLKENE